MDTKKLVMSVLVSMSILIFRSAVFAQSTPAGYAITGSDHPKNFCAEPFIPDVCENVVPPTYLINCWNGANGVCWNRNMCRNPYEGYSCNTCGVFEMEKAADSFEDMGYPTVADTCPDTNDIIEHVQNDDVVVYAEGGHSGSTYFSTSCDADGYHEIGISSNDPYGTGGMKQWLNGHKKKQFSFLFGCYAGLRDENNQERQDNFSYHLRKESDISSVVVAFNSTSGMCINENGEPTGVRCDDSCTVGTCVHKLCVNAENEPIGFCIDDQCDSGGTCTDSGFRCNF